MSWGLTWFSYATVSEALASSLQTSHSMLTAPWILSWLRLSLSAGPESSDASAEKYTCGEWPTGNAHPSVLLPWSPSIREHHQWVQVKRSSAWFLSFLLFSDWLDGAAYYYRETPNGIGDFKWQCAPHLSEYSNAIWRMNYGGCWNEVHQEQDMPCVPTAFLPRVLLKTSSFCVPLAKLNGSVVSQGNPRKNKNPLDHHRHSPKWKITLRLPQTHLLTMMEQCGGKLGKGTSWSHYISITRCIKG